MSIEGRSYLPDVIYDDPVSRITAHIDPDGNEKLRLAIRHAGMMAQVWMMFWRPKLEAPFSDCYPSAGVQIAGDGTVVEYSPLNASVYAAVPYDGPTNWLDRVTLGFAREDAKWHSGAKEYFQPDE